MDRDTSRTKRTQCRWDVNPTTDDGFQPRQKLALANWQDDAVIRSCAQHIYDPVFAALGCHYDHRYCEIQHAAHTPQNFELAGLRTERAYNKNVETEVIDCVEKLAGGFIVLGGMPGRQ